MEAVHKKVPRDSVAAGLPLELPTEGYVRLPQILRVFPVSRSTWWSGVATGRFPAGVKLGPRTTAWQASSIRELLARFDLLSERNPKLKEQSEVSV